MHCVCLDLQKLYRLLSKFLCHIQTFFGFNIFSVDAGIVTPEALSLPYHDEDRVQKNFKEFKADAFKESDLRLSKKIVSEIFINDLFYLFHDICMEKT